MTPRVEFSQTKPWIAPRKCFQALAASLALISGPAFAQTGPVSVAPGHSPLQRIDDSVSLPGGWLAVRRDGADDLFLISGDGRYVVQPAQMVDTQTGRALRDYPSVAASVRDPVLARLDGVWDDLRPVDRGEGAHDVIVFTDPHCPYCKALIAELAAYRDTVRVRVIEVPILGQASNPLVVEAFCAADPAAGSDAVFGVGPRDGLAQIADCPRDILGRRLVVAQLLGLRAVPFLIDARDGRFSEGRPDDLAAWLEAGS
jgi:thiol:disulfide interchange protein DsbC